MNTHLINILLVFRTSVVWFRNQVHICQGLFTVPFSVFTFCIVHRNKKGAFLWGDLDQDHWSLKITQIMVHQRN